MKQQSASPRLRAFTHSSQSGNRGVLAALNADSGYHCVMVESQKGGAAWSIVNGHGLPDDTLTSFAGHLASTIGWDRDLHTLGQFYTFAIARQTYGYQHPSGRLRWLF